MIQTKSVPVEVRQMQKQLVCDGCKIVGYGETDERMNESVFSNFIRNNLPEGWSSIKQMTPAQTSHFTHYTDLCEDCTRKALAAVIQGKR